MQLEFNAFRFAGDMTHLFAFIFLVYKIIRNRSCGDISGKTQILLATVFITRYFDAIYNPLSIYHLVMKLTFVGCTLAIVFLTYVVFRRSHRSEHDTFYSELLVFGAFILSLFVSYAANTCNVIDLLWTYSIYMETVAALPQMDLVIKKGGIERTTCCYLTAIGLYRALYVCNWAYRYNYESQYWDPISTYAGVTQTLIFVAFLIYVKATGIPVLEDSMYGSICADSDAKRSDYLRQLHIVLEPSEGAAKTTSSARLDLEEKVKLAEAEAGVAGVI